MNRDINDKIRGSLIGGAAGDALGYAVEFSGEREIFSVYGKDGITEYRFNQNSGKAVVSDDTQMTLFTANGILSGITERVLNDGNAPLHRYVECAYQDWLYTQMGSHRSESHKSRTWLLSIPELFVCRAPGGTCLSALETRPRVNDYIAEPVNDSKGCGGVMRVAPVGLFSGDNENWKLDLEGAYVAAVAHGHPLGYMPAAVVTHIINRLVYGSEAALKDIVIEARDACAEIFN